jgi:hypothetical protein
MERGDPGAARAGCGVRFLLGYFFFAHFKEEVTRREAKPESIIETQQLAGALSNRHKIKRQTCQSGMKQSLPENALNHKKAPRPEH